MRIKINDLRKKRFCVIVVFTGEKICSCVWIQGIKVTSQREMPLLLSRRKELIFFHNALLFVYRLLQTSLTTANDVREVSKRLAIRSRSPQYPKNEARKIPSRSTSFTTFQNTRKTKYRKELLYDSRCTRIRDARVKYFKHLLYDILQNK